MKGSVCAAVVLLYLGIVRLSQVAEYSCHVVLQRKVTPTPLLSLWKVTKDRLGIYCFMSGWGIALLLWEQQ